jgi:hypothetical protein
MLIATRSCILASNCVPLIPCSSECSRIASLVEAAVAAAAAWSLRRCSSLRSCRRFASAFRCSSSRWAFAAPSPSASACASAVALAARVRASSRLATSLLPVCFRGIPIAVVAGSRAVMPTLSSDINWLSSPRPARCPNRCFASVSFSSRSMPFVATFPCCSVWL